MITDVVKHELSYLIQQVKEVAMYTKINSETLCFTMVFAQNKDVDMEKDWKLLTILIGANDLCLG